MSSWFNKKQNSILAIFAMFIISIFFYKTALSIAEERPAIAYDGKIYLYDIENNSTKILADNIDRLYNYDLKPRYSISGEYVAWLASEKGDITIINHSTLEITTISMEKRIIGFQVYNNYVLLRHGEEFMIYNISSNTTKTLLKFKNDQITSGNFNMNSNYLLYKEWTTSTIYLLNLKTNDTTEICNRADNNVKDCVSSLLHNNEVLLLYHNGFEYSLELSNLSDKIIIYEGKNFPLLRALQDEYAIWLFWNGTLVYYNRITENFTYNFLNYDNIYYLSAQNNYIAFLGRESSNKRSDIYLYNINSQSTIRLTNTKDEYEQQPLIDGNYVIWASFKFKQQSFIPSISFSTIIVAIMAISVVGRYYTKHN